MCVTSIILSLKKKSVFNVDKIKLSLKNRRNYFCFKIRFIQTKNLNMAHLPKLGIADSHRVERIEIFWLGKMNMTLLCYLQIHILRIAIIFSIKYSYMKTYLFFYSNFGYFNFSSLQKSTTTRVSVSQPKV